MADDKKLVLVSGATGSQGGAIARELLGAGWPVRAMTRKPESENAKALSALGATVVRADLDDEASLRKALDGAWGAVAVQNTWEAGVDQEEQQGLRFARVAKEVGLPHLLYQSVGSAHRDTGIPHFENKRRIEQSIEQLGLPSWTVIRPVFFMENLLGPFFKPYIQQGSLAMGLKAETSLQMIAVRDIGTYGLRAIERHATLNGRSIDIAGDALTGPQAAVILTEIAGRPIGFYSVPIEQIRSASEDFAIMLEWFDAVGYNVDIAKTSAEFGVRPTTFRLWASEQSWS